MMMISKIQALSKLRRFCALSFAELDTLQLNATTSRANGASCQQPAIQDGNRHSDADSLPITLDESELELLDAFDEIDAGLRGSDRGQCITTKPQLQHNMIGQSKPMLDIYEFISKVAPTDSTVLIYGESGTGKELAARAIHQNSLRADKPFVAINCAAIVETLLESELFGHEKGAFTGATTQKKGKLEIANGGTVFLDELGELAPMLQAKLLRVLQEQEFERLGSTRSIQVDIRLIAATNKDLLQAVSEGSFRKDLYYRLNVVSFEMPPLRERQEDIIPLANYFAAKFEDKGNRRISGISAAVQAHLRDYHWPGNVRELENVIERAVVLGNADVILLQDLPQMLIESEPKLNASVTTISDGVKESKKHLILKAIDQASGNYTEAAKLLGVHPNHLHRLVRTMNLRAVLKK